MKCSIVQNVLNLTTVDKDRYYGTYFFPLLPQNAYIIGLAALIELKLMKFEVASNLFLFGSDKYWNRFEIAYR